MISTRLVELVIDTVACLTLAKWETVSGQFGGHLIIAFRALLQDRPEVLTATSTSGNPNAECRLRTGACVTCVAKLATPCKITAKPYTRPFV